MHYQQDSFIGTNKPYCSGDAPSKYLERIQKHAQVDDESFRNILQTHVLTPGYLYMDDFEGFFTDRKELILQRIERAMNKAIPRDTIRSEEGIFLDDETDEAG